MNLKIIKPHQCSLERSHAVLIVLNADNKTQSFKMWPKPSIKSFTSSSDSSLQISLKLENIQVKIYFTGFNLTFQKRFVQTDHKYHPSSLGDEENTLDRLKRS